MLSGWMRSAAPAFIGVRMGRRNPVMPVLPAVLTCVACREYGVARLARGFAVQVRQGPIAFTLAAAPSEPTPALLRMRADRDVPATFFQCGSNVQRLPEIARDVARG